MLSRRMFLAVSALLVSCVLYVAPPASSGEANAVDRPGILFHDSHVHLTNYIQEGLTAEDFLKRMGEKVGRAALFGLPLQQKWDYFVSGDRAPDYYLLSDASLYYYSFTDAMIAEEYRRLPIESRKRLDPMITGFNPTDMYAADHIARVLRMYPGVFVGIGEFSIHKEFVSSKITGHTASLKNKAFSRILSFAGETGLLVNVHCDIDTVRPAKGRPAHFDDLCDVLHRHQDASVIWAHTGLGRFVGPTDRHVELLGEMLARRDLQHVNLDISWDLVAGYIVADAETTGKWARLMKAYPDRFLFGTDSVAPKSQEAYLRTYSAYRKLWDALDEKTLHLVAKGNYERLFDAASLKVRAWEREHARQ